MVDAIKSTTVSEEARNIQVENKPINFTFLENVHSFVNFGPIFEEMYIPDSV